MKNRYSPSTGSFYPLDIDYLALPADLIEVAQSDYCAAMARPAGHTFAFIDGALVISAPPEPTDADLSAQRSAEILAQISVIEQTRQPRALREATLTGDKTRLTAIEFDITALRAQLV